MNIDEFESGKGLRLYFSGIREYATRQAQILSQKDSTRWHYKQRRVRARREWLQKRIDQMLRVYPCGKIVVIKERGRKTVGVLLNEYTK